jgi:opacity protein-like surface antigen
LTLRRCAGSFKAVVPHPCSQGCGRIEFWYFFVKKQLLAAIISTGFSVTGFLVPAAGQAQALPGFYGGVVLRDAAAAATGTGLNLGPVASAWVKYALPGEVADASQSLLFSGYRFANDMAVELAVGQTTSYALRVDMGAVSAFAARTPGLTFSAPRSWNLDFYTSYNLPHSFALYGRVGYLQQDSLPALAGVAGAGEARLADGVNYGVGVRYDVSSALGLKLEYARFARYGADASAGWLPNSDQVRLGVQYRF